MRAPPQQRVLPLLPLLALLLHAASSYIPEEPVIIIEDADGEDRDEEAEDRMPVAVSLAACGPSRRVLWLLLLLLLLLLCGVSIIPSLHLSVPLAVSLYSG